MGGFCDVALQRGLSSRRHLVDTKVLCAALNATIWS